MWQLLIATCLAQSLGSPSIQFPVEKQKLDNGLTVLLQKDNSIPITIVQLWYHVGSRQEGGGPKGLAHLFEHMMFKGTKNHPGKEYDQLVESSGGKNNAFTTHDHTAYYVLAPSKKLETLLALEADRMTGLALDSESLKKELEVVKEERRMRTDNSPMGTAYEKIYEGLYKGSEYGWPVIGSMQDISSITLNDAEKFYRTYYAPNNATLVIAGDINVSQTLRWVKKYFGAIPRSDIPSFQWHPPQEIKKSQLVEVKKKVESPILMLAMPSAPETSEDTPALDLLAYILFRDPSSRLYKKLVYEKKWASAVSISSYGEESSGTFMITANLKSKDKLEDARNLIMNEVSQLKKKMISAAELEKVQVQTTKDFIDVLKTGFGRARMLAFYDVTYGDYARLFQKPAEYDRVTPKDISRVANKYLNFDKGLVVKVVSP